MAGLIFRNIRKSYGSNEVIRDLNLEIEAGEFVTLLGPSGCGKTTLLRMIAGLESIQAGELYIGGKKMNGLPPQRRPIGMVFQSYALFPHMSVKKNISFGLKVQGMTEGEIFTKLDWVLPLLRLEEYENRLPRELSGGQRQRVALARALVLDPEVLLLDEPLSNLDAALREMATEELKRVHQKVGKTVVYVTHNQMEAMVMSRRIAAMSEGNIEQYGTPAQLYDNPQTIFTAQFIGSPVTNTLDGEIGRDEEGDVVVYTSIGALKLFAPPSVGWDHLMGREVRACIRPQDIFLKEEYGISGFRRCDTELLIRVDMLETPGDRTLVVAAGDLPRPLRFFVDRSHSLKRVEKYKIIIPGDRIHIFDARTGLNVLSE